jgi:hypothetical protein
MDKPGFCVWLDFNGTLVRHRQGDPVWKDGEVLIGTPVREMVTRVRRHLAKGRKFVLKSAMMSDPDSQRRAKVEKALGDWSLKHLGQRLEVTATCRPEFIDQWDDKVKRVLRNEGVFAEEQTTGDDEDGKRSLGDAAASGQHPGSGGKADGEGGGGSSGRAREAFGEWADWQEWD